MRWDYCDKCGKRTRPTQMWTKKVCGATMDDPAEYERYCLRESCKPSDPEQDAERASLKGYSDEERERI